MTDLLDKNKIKEIQETFDSNVSQIDKLLEKDFKEPSIIMTVSTFEAFMSDIFELNYKKWFKHTSKDVLSRLNDSESRREIYKYLRNINAYDEFLEKRYIYFDNISINGFAETETLYEVLLGKIPVENSKNKKEKGKINFQSLNGKLGVKDAYKAVFNINLVHSLDKEKNKSKGKWKELNEFFDERHEIIHNGKKTKFSKERICNILDSIKYMRNYLIDELINEEKRSTQGKPRITTNTN